MIKFGKCVLFVWLVFMCGAFASSGTCIAPVLISVTDAEGHLIEGAVVELHSERLARIPQEETDPHSEISKLGRKAIRKGQTDAFGNALMYCGGGWIPSGNGKGVSQSLSGTVTVTAQGYRSATVEFRRSFATLPEQGTEMMLHVKVVMQEE